MGTIVGVYYNQILNDDVMDSRQVGELIQLLEDYKKELEAEDDWPRRKL